jgi:hypothetical protein
MSLAVTIKQRYLAIVLDAFTLASALRLMLKFTRPLFNRPPKRISVIHFEVIL